MVRPTADSVDAVPAAKPVELNARRRALMPSFSCLPAGTLPVQNCVPAGWLIGSTIMRRLSRAEFAPNCQCAQR